MESIPDNTVTDKMIYEWVEIEDGLKLVIHRPSHSFNSVVHEIKVRLAEAGFHFD